MAVCTWCDKEMITGASCTLDVLTIGGAAFRLPPARRACGDCGVSPGGLHHPGCDLQRCPVCGWQLITCDCRFDDQSLRGDDWDDEEDWDDDDEPGESLPADPREPAMDEIDRWRRR